MSVGRSERPCPSRSTRDDAVAALGERAGEAVVHALVEQQSVQQDGDPWAVAVGGVGDPLAVVLEGAWVGRGSRHRADNTLAADGSAPHPPDGRVRRPGRQRRRGRRVQRAQRAHGRPAVHRRSAGRRERAPAPAARDRPGRRLGGRARRRGHRRGARLRARAPVGPVAASWSRRGRSRAASAGSCSRAPGSTATGRAASRSSPRATRGRCAPTSGSGSTCTRRSTPPAWRAA